MFTSNEQWQDRQQEIAAYQHHQEQMKTESRNHSEVDNSISHNNNDDEYPFFIHILYGLIGSILTYVLLQGSNPYFDTNITWELYTLIGVEIIGFIAGAILIPILLVIGFFGGVLYLLYNIGLYFFIS